MLFAGNGVTGAINLLVSMIGLYPRERNQGAMEGSADNVVLVGPWEHHSNILPWRLYYIGALDDLNLICSSYYNDGGF